MRRREFLLAAAPAPRVAARLEEIPRLVLLPDQRYAGFFIRRTAAGQEAARIDSTNGVTWQAPSRLFPLDPRPGGWLYTEALVDQNGEIHLFLLNEAGTGRTRNIDIWHTRSTGTRTRWPAPKRIWTGYTGSLNSVIQMRGGRVLLPFSYRTPRTWRERGTGTGAFTFTGSFNSTLIYSDDQGASWEQAPAHLKVPTPDINGSYGAVEPVVVQLNDGRVWMLIRTQLGRFWESFSPNGIEWSAPQPTRLLSSDSPAGLVRLADGRLVLLWNNCQRFPYAHGGRHVLHAAISTNDGRTWSGYREAARDPRNGEPPPPHGDHGTAYPYPLAGRDGKVLFATGQGSGRRILVELDPEWLNEKSQTDDFASGLDQWSTFATRGIAADRGAMRIERADSDWPAVAVWNFPNGASGSVRIALTPSATLDARILLTDHFSTPLDEEDFLNCLYGFDCGRAMLTPERRQEIELEWNAAKRECTVKLDGRGVGVIPSSRESAGANYLRIRVKRGSMHVHRVEARVQ
ncbi:MAG: exo-alpha-sialidase [Acidobacteria bacterium]|nr:exo-alpha-sialidase [Acidobacteriota bacterium]